MSPAIVEVNGISKKFSRRGEAFAIENITLNVGNQTVFGLLGADGAGKTTLFRILATLLRPTRGWARIGGFDIVADRSRVKRIVGYAPKNPALHRRITVQDYLNFWGMVDGYSKAERIDRNAHLMSFLQLEGVASANVLECGTLAQALLFLAQAMYAGPEVILLDEPMVGFRASERDMYAEKLRSLAREGKTVLLSSSKLEDLRAACSHLVVMADGHTTRVYETRELLKAVGEGHHARIFVEGDNIPAKAISQISRHKGVIDIKQSGSSVVLYVEPLSVDGREIEGALEMTGVKGARVREAEITLGDIFRTLSSRKES